MVLLFYAGISPEWYFEIFRVWASMGILHDGIVGNENGDMPHYAVQG